MVSKSYISSKKWLSSKLAVGAVIATMTAVGGTAGVAAAMPASHLQPRGGHGYGNGNVTNNVNVTVNGNNNAITVIIRYIIGD